MTGVDGYDELGSTKSAGLLGTRAGAAFPRRPATPSCVSSNLVVAFDSGPAISVR